MGFRQVFIYIIRYNIQQKESISIDTREGFLQWLAAQVSSGLYNPQEVAVSCK